MKKSELRQIIKEELLKEGTWAIDKKSIKPFIKELKKIEDKYFDKVGDDSVWDGIGVAISRAEELLKVKD